MPITHFHDGRILITTVTGAPTSAEVATAVGTVRARLGTPVLLDAREGDAAGLGDCIGQLLEAGGRARRFAILLSDERLLEQGATFGLIAGEHGAEAQTFETVGLALRWLWRLDDASLAQAPLVSYPRSATATAGAGEPEAPGREPRPRS